MVHVVRVTIGTFYKFDLFRTLSTWFPSDVFLRHTAAPSPIIFNIICTIVSGVNTY